MHTEYVVAFPCSHSAPSVGTMNIKHCSIPSLFPSFHQGTFVQLQGTGHFFFLKHVRALHLLAVLCHATVSEPRVLSKRYTINTIAHWLSSNINSWKDNLCFQQWERGWWLWVRDTCCGIIENVIMKNIKILNCGGSQHMVGLPGTSEALHSIETVL